MDFAWSAAQSALYKKFSEFAQKELGHDLAERDRQQVFDQAGWLRCGEMGLTGMCAPSQFGGGGYDALDMVAALEGLGYGSKDNGLNFSIGAHLWGTVTPLSLFGDPQQKDNYLPRLCSGEWAGALAATEAEAGSDIYSMKSKAVKLADGYSLSGEKIMITNAPIAQVFIVIARLEGAEPNKDLCAFLVEKGAPGLQVSPSVEKMGLRTAQMGSLVLNDCHIPFENLLGAEGNGTVLFAQAMEWERGLILAPALGTMQRQLEVCKARVRNRRQFGQPIGQFQRVADKIVDMYLHLESSRAFIRKFAWLKSNKRTAQMEASAAKLHTSEAWIAVSQAALQIHGGMGYLTENEIEHDLRDALGSRIYSGTSEIQRQIISHWLA